MKYFLTITILISLLACQTKTGDTISESLDSIATKASQLTYSNIDVATAKKIKEEQPNVIFLDVRTPKEIAEGKIEGALEIDFRNKEFNDKVSALDQSKEYVVYCRSGGRSAKASQLMIDNGFTKVKNLEGGFQQYNK